MQTFINTLKIFFRIPSVVVPFFIMVITDNILMYKIVTSFVNAQLMGMSVDSMYYYGDMGVLCFLLSIIPMFMGCEFLRRNNQCNLDQIAMSAHSINIIKINQIEVLCALLLMHVINIGVYFFVGFSKVGVNSILAGEIIVMFFCDYVLLPFSALAMGVLVARIKNKYVGYGLVILVCLFYLSTTADILTEVFHKTSIPVYLVQDFINILPPDITATYDPLYGFPMESYRFFSKVFWIVLALFLEIMHMTYRIGWKRIVLMIVGCCSFVLLGYGVVHKGSVLRMTDYAVSGLEDTNFYYGDESTRQKEKEENFYIKNYDMELTFDDQLYAKVIITLDKKMVQKEYCFTLFHGYCIDSVQDAKGEKLDFSRDGDYVTVKNESGQEIQQLVFYYKGYSSTFYSSKKACFLPGIFPYYPKAGYVKVYQDGYVDCDNKNAHFRVKTNGILPFSNLSRTGDYYEGDCKNVVMLYGYYDVIQNEHCNIVYYPLNGLSKEVAGQIQKKELERKFKNLCEYLGISESDILDEKNIIIIPSSLVFNSVMKSMYDCGQYSLIGDSATEYDVLESRLSCHEKKQLLKDEFFYLMPGEDGDIFNETLYSEEVTPSEYEEYMEIHDLYVTKARELGIKEVSRKVIKFLMDDSNTENEIEFMKSLK